MLTLYHNDMSVCAAKVRIVLAEKGLEWNGVHLNLRAGDTLKPDYLKLNANGVVPTLVHGDKVVIESNVICEYLDDAFPSNPLRPADAIGKARMRLWMKQLDEGVHASTGNMSTCVAFRYQHLSKTKEEMEDYFRKVPNEERRVRIRQAVEQGLEAPVFTAAIKRFDKLIGDFEAALAERPWLAGDSYSLAEVAYTPYMIRLDHFGFTDLFKGRPRASAWKQRLFDRASFEPAVARWFNPDYLALFREHGPKAQQKVRAILGPR